ncbi:hypothetical protein GCM10009601_04650 [Streptomyces thermospinosisporus]|uniref:Uncharacterized protein n=1 Tax=Streptomyces thermospinosisporus TaxID=161482 RepID=A0ABN3Y6H8_9ACTN
MSVRAFRRPALPVQPVHQNRIMTVPALLEAVSLPVPDELATADGLTVNDVLLSARDAQVG